MTAPNVQEGTAMAKEGRTEIQNAEKAGVPAVAEQTRPEIFLLQEIF